MVCRNIEGRKDRKMSRWIFSVDVQQCNLDNGEDVHVDFVASL